MNGSSSKCRVVEWYYYYMPILFEETLREPRHRGGEVNDGSASDAGSES